MNTESSGSIRVALLIEYSYDVTRGYFDSVKAYRPEKNQLTKFLQTRNVMGIHRALSNGLEELSLPSDSEKLQHIEILFVMGSLMGYFQGAEQYVLQYVTQNAPIFPQAWYYSTNADIKMPPFEYKQIEAEREEKGRAIGRTAMAWADKYTASTVRLNLHTNTSEETS
ncbi:MAG: hypothetical protein ABI758_06025 [Candidatus Woesebacteria bacterium]